MPDNLMRPLLGTALLGAVFLGLSPVHEEGVLRLASRTLVAGDSVRVLGEHFGSGTRLRLRLAGLPGTVQLGTVRADTAGAFTVWMLVPDSVVAGAWRLTAVADDDEVVASLDVQVTSAAPGAHDMAGMDDMASMGDEDGMPTGEPLALDRARTPALTWGIGGGILVTLLLGLALLWRADTNPRARP